MTNNMFLVLKQTPRQKYTKLKIYISSTLKIYQNWKIWYIWQHWRLVVAFVLRVTK